MPFRKLIRLSDEIEKPVRVPVTALQMIAYDVSKSTGILHQNDIKNEIFRWNNNNNNNNNNSTNNNNNNNNNNNTYIYAG